jgi:hypothetical protein
MPHSTHNGARYLSDETTLGGLEGQLDSLSLPVDMWDRTTSQGRERYLETLAASLKRKESEQGDDADDLQCQNCSVWGDHRNSECLWHCGSCGERGHKSWDCVRVREQCICAGATPGHLRDDCPVICYQPFRYDLEHSAISCGQCCSCGEIDHSYDQGCDKFATICGCGSISHFSFEHDYKMPDATKRARCRPGCPLYFCDIHCQKCLMKTTEVDRHEPCVAIIEKHVQCGWEGHNCVKFGQSCKECFPDGE